MSLIEVENMGHHYKSYQLRFSSKPDIMKALGQLTLSTVKKIANRLGLQRIADLYEAFTDDGFYCTVPETMDVYDITVDRKTGLDALREMNGSITKYRMGQTYEKHISNQYRSYGSKSDLKFLSVMNKLPVGIQPADMLCVIEEKAEKTTAIKEGVRCYSEEYVYEGIPVEVILVTWLMMVSTGRDTVLSRSYITSIFSSDYANPRVRTMKFLAEAWGMSLKAFIKAIEQDNLVLGGRKSLDEDRNTKESVMFRIIELTEYESWYDFARSFPEERKITVRNLIHIMDSYIEIYTILALIKPFPDIRLSDVFT